MMTGFDVDSAIEYIISSLSNLHPNSNSLHNSNSPNNSSFNLSADRLDDQPQLQPRGIAASGSRPLIVSRDSFDGFIGGNGGRGNANQPIRWQSPSQAQFPSGIQRMPLPQQSQSQSQDGPNSGGVGGRVCRYYLSGNCLRSDCT
jgi:hypothetical protein